MSAFDIVLGFFVLFAIAFVWVTAKAISLKDDLDIERGKHAITARYLKEAQAALRAADPQSPPSQKEGQP